MSSDVAEELILDAVRKVSGYVKANEAEFVRLVTETSSAQHEQMTKANRMRLSESQKRIAELDRLIRQIYEDKVNGGLSDKRFEKLSAEYEGEQEELEQSIEALQAEIDNFDEQSARADKFLQLTKRYINFTELTTPMLYEFIEKVVVHERVKEGRYTKSQKIDIHFNFVGLVELPEAYLANDEDNEISKADLWKRYVPKGSAFVPLGQYLDQQSGQGTSSLQLTFSEIEAILGRPLSKSAYKYPAYWYPSKNRPASNVIFNAGYDVERVDLKAGTLLLKKSDAQQGQ